MLLGMGNHSRAKKSERRGTHRPRRPLARACSVRTSDEGRIHSYQPFRLPALTLHNYEPQSQMICLKGLEGMKELGNVAEATVTPSTPSRDLEHQPRRASSPASFTPRDGESMRMQLQKAIATIADKPRSWRQRDNEMRRPDLCRKVDTICKEDPSPFAYKPLHEPVKRRSDMFQEGCAMKEPRQRLVMTSGREQHSVDVAIPAPSCTTAYNMLMVRIRRESDNMWSNDEALRSKHICRRIMFHENTMACGYGYGAMPLSSRPLRAWRSVGYRLRDTRQPDRNQRLER